MRPLATLTLALTAACAWQPSPVVMVGPENEVYQLAGEWSGEYRSAEAGRSGTIWFKLDAQKDTAFGDVLMIPREPVMTSPEPSAPKQGKDLPSVLTIKFVRVDGTRITGAIDPYPSPDCGCMLFTVFRGELSGDRIVGDFMILHSGEEKVQSGVWWANRRPAVVVDERE